MGGDSNCLMHSFSYASPTTPNEAKRGNLMNSVGDSISFGRFMTESSCLDWEKWSSFSHKRYVEEAARYAQPGSVAEKKAFFEAHYKRIAARNAAALLEQQQQQQQEKFTDDVSNSTSPKTDEEITRNIRNLSGDGYFYQSAITDHKENKAPQDEDIFTKTAESQKTADDTESELSEISQTSKPLLKSSSLNQQVSSKKRLSFSSTMNLRKASNKLPHSPAKYPIQNKNISNTREGGSLRSLLNFSSTKEPVIPPAPALPKVKSTKKPPKACSTPLRTPPIHQAAKIRMLKVTPCSEKRSNSSFVDPSVDSGSKTAWPKWHILSAVLLRQPEVFPEHTRTKSLTACKNKLQSPTCSTPFLLRTEERAARRKQKLEEKFNSKADENGQLQTKLKEKADKEIRKFRQSCCFKARPLPSFYKENETNRSQTDKIQTLGIIKSSGNKIQGINSRTPPISLSNKGGSKKNSQSPGY